MILPIRSRQVLWRQRYAAAYYTIIYNNILHIFLILKVGPRTFHLKSNEFTKYNVQIFIKHNFYNYTNYIPERCVHRIRTTVELMVEQIKATHIGHVWLIAHKLYVKWLP